MELVPLITGQLKRSKRKCFINWATARESSVNFPNVSTALFRRGL